jgi:hypothetical protein
MGCFRGATQQGLSHVCIRWNAEVLWAQWLQRLPTRFVYHSERESVAPDMWHAANDAARGATTDEGIRHATSHELPYGRRCNCGCSGSTRSVGPGWRIRRRRCTSPRAELHNNGAELHNNGHAPFHDGERRRLQSYELTAAHDRAAEPVLRNHGNTAGQQCERARLGLQPKRHRRFELRGLSPAELTQHGIRFAIRCRLREPTTLDLCVRRRGARRFRAAGASAVLGHVLRRRAHCI